MANELKLFIGRDKHDNVFVTDDEGCFEFDTEQVVDLASNNHIYVVLKGRRFGIDVRHKHLLQEMRP